MSLDAMLDKSNFALFHIPVTWETETFPEVLKQLVDLLPPSLSKNRAPVRSSPARHSTHHYSQNTGNLSSLPLHYLHSSADGSFHNSQSFHNRCSILLPIRMGLARYSSYLPTLSRQTNQFKCYQLGAFYFFSIFRHTKG